MSGNEHALKENRVSKMRQADSRWPKAMQELMTDK